MAKKIYSFKGIPLKEIDHKTYMKLYRSDKPEKLAKELGILDHDKIKQKQRLLKKLVIGYACFTFGLSLGDLFVKMFT